MDTSMALVCDVDGTLLGDDAALGHFAEWYLQREREIRLVYNSGRFIDSVMESVATTLLPTPDAIIGGVGTEIGFPATGNRLTTWWERFHEWNPDAIAEMLKDDPRLQPQPAEFQSNYKRSYYAHNLTPSELDELHRRVSTVSSASLVYSSQRDLDFLPSQANKGTATAFLGCHWGLSYDRIIVAGDSGNDKAMFELGFLGIVVANAQPELQQLADRRIYLSPYSYASGVLDGLRQWLPDDPPPLPSHVSSTLASKSAE